MMPTWHELARRWKIGAVNLVDKSEDSRARVVLYKRDEESENDECKCAACKRRPKRGGSDDLALPEYRPHTDPRNWGQRWEKSTMSKTKLKDLMVEIGKSETVTKAEVIDAVVKKASRRAQKRGTRPDLEEARLWRKIYSTPHPQIDVSTAEGRKVPMTEAEWQIEDIAKRLRKRDGLSYAESISRALCENPHLYSEYVEQSNSGRTYACLEPVGYKTAGFLSRSEEEAIAKRKARAKRKDDPGTNYASNRNETSTPPEREEFADPYKAKRRAASMEDEEDDEEDEDDREENGERDNSR
jgi:hypothetical protein